MAAAVAVAVALVGDIAAAPAGERKVEHVRGAARKLSFVTSEGTWLSVDVSPDGRTLAFDLLGDLYLLPIEGGRARVLTAGLAWDKEPRFSPDGTRLAFVSDRDGADNLWIASLGRPSPPIQVSHESADVVSSPEWLPDGRQIIARQKTALRSANYQGPWALSRYPADGGSKRMLHQETGRRMLGGASAHPDGRRVYLSYQSVADEPAARQWGAFQIFVQDLESGSIEQITEGHEGAFRPEVSPDGKWLAFGRRSAGRTDLWVRDLETHAEKILLERITRDEQSNRAMNDLLPAYGWTPDSRHIVISRAGRLVRVERESGTIVHIPFEVAVERQLSQLVTPERRLTDDPVRSRVLRWQALDTHRHTLLFQALGKIWTRGYPHGAARPLNTRPGASAYDDAALLEYAPAWSTDGARVAYTTWSDRLGGDVRVKLLVSGETRILTRHTGRYSNPVFSADGRRLAYVSEIAFAQAKTRGRHAYDIRLHDLDSGDDRSVTQFAQFDLTLDEASPPRPFFSSQGDRLFYLEVHAHLDTRLVSVRLDGSDKRSHLAIEWADDAQLSPDGRQIAIVAQEDLYLYPLRQPLAAVNAERPIALREMRRLTFRGATHPVWLDERTLTWGSADTFFLSDVGGSESAITQTDIRLTVPRDAPRGVVAFVGARVLHLQGRKPEIIEDAAILVRDNRIEDVGPRKAVRIPPEVATFDIAERTVMPGLVDMHAHPSFELDILPRQQPDLTATLALGVTTIFDPAVPTVPVFVAAELIEAGESIGPRIFSTGDQVRGFASGGNEWITDFAAAERVVDRLVRHGAISVKSYGLPARLQRQWLADLADRRNLHITAENTGDFHLAMTFAADGYTGLEHSIAQVPLYADAVKFLAFSGTAYNPLLIAPRAGVGARAFFEGALDHRLEDRVGAVSDTRIRDLARRLRSAGRAERGEYVFQDQGREAAKILRAGGRLVTGSHAAGLALHFDIWGHVAAGLSPAEALRAATIEGARALGLERDLGSVERGKLADFVVLTGNPLEDIRNTAAIEHIVKNGRVYSAMADEVWPQPRKRPPYYYQSLQTERQTGTSAP